MKPLEKALRNQLEKTVREARDVSETAARIALEQLAVAEASAFPHLNESEKELRRKLRTHGRQLGDPLNGKKTQSMERLIEEVAYQHWHRMLFARFLAENNLLMYPDAKNPVPVTLEECKDLAAKEGVRNGWELAAQFAAHMLPQIFRLSSPVFQLSLSPENQQKLEQLIDDLPHEVFIASDSLGWVYQFWQAKKKEMVNASEVKIGSRELPAVTQLFTEPYMVSFLLDNTLGAWWASSKLTAHDFSTAGSEEELRKKASLPSLPLKYLRFTKSSNGVWSPAAGSFSQWPHNLSEIKVLDPCCGSGHFLVAAFLMLVPMRIELEKLSPERAVDLVLTQNLNGLEIDERCVELAAFALALTAWRYPATTGYRKLPELNIACSGLSMSESKDEWLAIAGKNTNLKYSLSQLYELFKDAPTLGSLINPEIGLGKGTIVEMEWGQVAPLLTNILSGEQDSQTSEMGVVAQGLAKAAQLLSMRYNLIVTNVPYLVRGKQCDILRNFCSRYHSTSKNDLATVFLDRCVELCCEGGTSAIVQPQNWLFLTTFKKFREKLLKDDYWHMVAWLGSGAFETITGEVVKVILLAISRGNPKRKVTSPDKTSKSLVSGIDVSQKKAAAEKAAELVNATIKPMDQISQLRNPDFRIVLENVEGGELLEKYSDCVQGLRPADRGMLVRCFFEIDKLGTRWKYLQSASECTQHYSGMRGIFDLETFDLKWKELGSAYKGHKQWGKHGVCMSQMSSLPTTIYTGAVYDGNINVFDVYQEENLPAVWTFCSSPEFKKLVRLIDKKLAVTNATLIKVPFDLPYWAKVAKDKYPNGLPKPYSSDPTQWIFHGHPAFSDEPLQVAMARLVGYQWPAEVDSNIELSDQACEYVKRAQKLMVYADADGIVCIPSVRGEEKGDERLENLLAAAYGEEWSPGKKSELLTKADHAGKSLESWLRDKCFAQHCRLFNDRPFVWHIWDGLNDGFSCFLNYHKLDAKLLETLIYSYLGDWISRQKQDIAKGIDGSEERLSAAEALKKRLELVVEGEKPYDIFVRWKPITKQPIGWNPDINDGVRLNIRPFLTGTDIGKKGAGVLRERPNIDWGKDRGKDQDSAPWYQLGPQYGGSEGDRINDHHLSLSEKRSAIQALRKTD